MAKMAGGLAELELEVVVRGILEETVVHLDYQDKMGDRIQPLTLVG